jgi:hypothetical protein
MLNFENAGVVARLYAQNGAVGTFLVLPDPTDPEGLRKISTETSWAGTPDGNPIKVRLRAFDGLKHGPVEEITGAMWRDLKDSEGRVTFPFFERLMRSVDANTAHFYGSAPSSPKPTTTAKVEPTQSYYQIRAIVRERDERGYPVIQIDGNTVRPRTEIDGLLIADIDLSGVIVATPTSGLARPLRHLIGQAERRAMAQCFVGAYQDWSDDWAACNPQELPNEDSRFDFSVWAQEQGFIGDGAGQFGMISNWEIRPDPERFVLNYALMDFSDGSMAVRRNHGNHGEPASWLVASAKTYDVRPQLFDDAALDLLEACRELAYVTEEACHRNVAKAQITDALDQARDAIEAAEELGLGLTESVQHVTRGATLLSDAQIKGMWEAAGGRFHGPNIETATMPEEKMFAFVRQVAARAPQADRSAQVDLNDSGFAEQLRAAVRNAFKAVADGTYFDDTSSWSLEAIPGAHGDDPEARDPVGQLIDKVTATVLEELRRTCAHEVGRAASEARITVKPGDSLWFDCGNVAVNVSRTETGEVLAQIWPQERIMITDAPMAEARVPGLSEYEVREYYEMKHTSPSP